MAEEQTNLAAALAEAAPELTSFAIDRPETKLDLTALRSRFIGGEAHFLQDDPVVTSDEELRLLDMIGRVSSFAEREILIVPPRPGGIGDWEEGYLKLDSMELTP